MFLAVIVALGAMLTCFFFLSGHFFKHKEFNTPFVKDYPKRQGPNSPVKAEHNTGQSVVPSPEPKENPVSFSMHLDLQYGPDKKYNRLDLFVINSDVPTPLAVFFHGGSFEMGSRRRIYYGLLARCLRAGISLASVEYTKAPDGSYPGPMLDGARAVQFLRFHSKKWNLDTERFAGIGGSCGGGIALWVGLHEDLANLKSKDPIERQSSRLQAIVGIDAQSTYDPQVIKKEIGGEPLREPAVRALFGSLGPKEFNTSLAGRLFKEASPVSHADRNDPPVFLFYTNRQGTLHNPKMGAILARKYRNFGVLCTVRTLVGYFNKKEVSIREAHDMGIEDAVGFLRKSLTAKGKIAREKKDNPLPSLKNFQGREIKVEYFPDLKYGPHDKYHSFDIWSLKSEKPTPWALFIHKGIFPIGNKEFGFPLLMTKCLEAGISFVAIDYTLPSSKHSPLSPVTSCLQAVKFVDSNTHRFNLDNERYGILGEGVGGSIALLIGFGDDLKEMYRNDDPERKSPGLSFAAAYEPTVKYIPAMIYPVLRFVEKSNENKNIHKLFDESKIISFIDKTDPPVFIVYSRSALAPVLKKKMDVMGINSTIREQNYYWKKGEDSLKVLERELDDLVAFFTQNLSRNHH